MCGFWLAFAFAPWALGQGVPKDLVKAYKWFALAATNGDDNRPELRDSISNGISFV